MSTAPEEPPLAGNGVQGHQGHPITLAQLEEPLAGTPCVNMYICPNKDRHSRVVLEQSVYLLLPICVFSFQLLAGALNKETASPVKRKK